MNSKMKRIFTYIIMTLILTITSGVILFIAGKPVLDYILYYIRKLIVQAI